MTKNQKTFLVILGLYVIFDFVLSSLVGIFIWDKTKEASSILTYYITLFTSIMIFSQISGSLVGKWGAQKVYIISIACGMLQAISVILFQNNLETMLIPIATIAGASVGIQSVAYSLVAAAIIRGEEGTKYISTKSSVMNTVSIIVVPIITYVISRTHSYTATYMAGALVGVVVMVLIARIEVNIEPSTYSPLQFFIPMFRDPEGRIYLLTRVLYGVFNGPVWAILGVVTYRFVGSVSVWGIISTGFTLLGIIGSHFYSKLNSPNMYRAVSGISALVFSGMAILLSTNWNLQSFLLYQVGLIVLNTTFSTHYEKMVYSIINKSDEFVMHAKEVVGMGEVAIGFGRLIILAGLLVSNFTFSDDWVLRLIFIAIASMPLLIMNTLQGAKIT